jgi:hypothetical protein
MRRLETEVEGLRTEKPGRLSVRHVFGRCGRTPCDGGAVSEALEREQILE